MSNTLLPFHYDARPIFTEHDLSALKKYVELMEKQFPSLRDAQVNPLEDAIQQTPCEDDEYDLRRQERDYVVQLFDEDLVQTMRHSFIVSLMSILEHRLREICEFVEKEVKAQFSSQELFGQPLDQFCLYLKKLKNLEVGSFPEWSAIRDLKTLRNCLAHQNGRVEKGDKNFEKIKALCESLSEKGVI